MSFSHGGGYSSSKKAPVTRRTTNVVGMSLYNRDAAADLLSMGENSTMVDTTGEGSFGGQNDLR